MERVCGTGTEAPRFVDEPSVERAAVCCLINVKLIEPVQLAMLEMKFEVLFSELVAAGRLLTEEPSDAKGRTPELVADSVVYLTVV